jgi:hypothetical protein
MKNNQEIRRGGVPSSMNFQSVNLCSWDYLVVDCGYVGRLIPEKNSIIETTQREGDEGEEDEHALMFFVDYDYHAATGKVTYKMTEVQPDEDQVFDTLMELTKKKKLGFSIRGAVVFKQGDWDIDLVEMLTKYRHCGCFGTFPYKVASFTTPNGKRVLYQQFDTESG